MGQLFSAPQLSRKVDPTKAPAAKPQETTTPTKPPPTSKMEDKPEDTIAPPVGEEDATGEEAEHSEDEYSEGEEGAEPKAAEGVVPEPPTKEATERLLEELKELRNPETEKNGFSVEPVDDNIAKWRVKLFGWEETSQIHEDMFLYQAETGRDHVLMEIIFPSHYPHSPFFLRAVYPRFHQYTGHITIGGSVCIKELTKSGWSSEFRLVTFLVMIRNLLLEGGALVDMGNLTEYSEQEGREAFVRVAQQHGWEP